MTPKQLRRALTRLNLTQRRTAQLLGVDDRSIRRWLRGDRAIPPPVATLIRLLLAGKVSADDLVPPESD